MGMVLELVPWAEEPNGGDSCKGGEDPRGECLHVNDYYYEIVESQNHHTH